MTLDEALRSPDPVAEIHRALSRKPPEDMSPPEKVFWTVAHFVGEALEEGLEHALAGPAGSFVPLVSEFAARYGPRELGSVLGELGRLFSGDGIAPGAEERADAVEALAQGGDDALHELTQRLAACEAAIEESLLAMARRNAAHFDLGQPPGDHSP